MYFQDSVSQTFEGREMQLYERMFMAGLCLPFSLIAQELVNFLGIAPSQIWPNGWRHFFASYFLWPTVLEGCQMSV